MPRSTLVAPIEPVDDPADPRLADYVGLPDAELRRSIEATSGTSYGCFIAEGITVIRRLLASPYRTRSVLVTPPKLRALQDALASIDAPVYVASPEVLAAVAGFDLHRGAVAAADRAAPLAVADLLAGRRTVALLEGLNDHENLGALARSAVALGVESLVLDATCADPLYRRSVRVSMGEILFLPYARATDWRRALASVRHAGFQLVALTPSAEATPIDLVEPAPGSRSCSGPRVPAWRPRRWPPRTSRSASRSPPASTPSTSATRRRSPSTASPAASS